MPVLGGEVRVAGGGDPLRKADDRLAAGIVTEEQGQQQSQQRQGGQKECDEPGHAARILSRLNSP